MKKNEPLYNRWVNKVGNYYMDKMVVNKTKMTGDRYSHTTKSSSMGLSSVNEWDISPAYHWGFNGPDYINYM